MGCNSDGAFGDSFDFDPWRAVGMEAGPVITDLKSCREKVLLRKKTVEDTRERWFLADSVASSAVGEAAPRTTVCISDAVEVETFNTSTDTLNLVLLTAFGLSRFLGKVEKG